MKPQEIRQRHSLRAVSDDEAVELLFADIFKSYEQALHRLAANLCKDDAMAADIVQEVFIKLWEIRTQLHEIENIEAFLFTLTRNKMMDFLRKAASDARLRQTLWDTMQGTALTNGIQTEAKELHHIWRKAVDQLSPQRKAIYLLREEGLNYQEIADQMHLSRHTVKNQLSAALRSIRQTINSVFR